MLHMQKVAINFVPISIFGRKFWLFLLQVPKCFGLVQIFCATPNIDFHIVPFPTYLCQTKRRFPFSKFGFCASTNFFWNSTKCYSIFGLAQNILGPVEVQSISFFLCYTSKFAIFGTQFVRKTTWARTSTGMDGTLHTDFRKSETSRDFKEYF